jgi:hypothetical protein
MDSFIEKLEELAKSLRKKKEELIESQKDKSPSDDLVEEKSEK